MPKISKLSKGFRKAVAFTAILTILTPFQSLAGKGKEWDYRAHQRMVSGKYNAKEVHRVRRGRGYGSSSCLRMDTFGQSLTVLLLMSSVAWSVAAACEKPGPMERAGKKAGQIGGGIAGGIAGSRGGAAGRATGAALGREAGGKLGEKAGRALDRGTAHGSGRTRGERLNRAAQKDMGLERSRGGPAKPPKK